MQDTVAIALIAVGGTMASALLSYIGTRHTTKTQLKGAEVSARNQLQAVRVEVKRLEAEQGESLRGARQSVYQEYLGAAYRFRNFFFNVSSVEDREAITGAGIALLDRQLEVELLGSDRVRERVEDVSDFLRGILSTAAEGDDGVAPFGDRLQDTFEAERQVWKFKIDALLKAMRSETVLT